MTSRFLPFIALLLAAFIFFWYVSTTWNGSIARAKAAIAADDQALAAAQQYTARQNELATARDAIDPAGLARLQTLLPDSVDNVGLVLDLGALAARSGLTLSKINVANAATNAGSTGGSPGGVQSPVGSVDLSLTASGAYGAFKNFLAGVENSARLLDIRDLAVRGSDTGVYTYQMTLRLYWLH